MSIPTQFPPPPPSVPFQYRMWSHRWVCSFSSSPIYFTFLSYVIPYYLLSSDEAAKRRLENMNSELKGLELRMKELEAKLYTANNLKPLYGDADARY